MRSKVAVAEGDGTPIYWHKMRECPTVPSSTRVEPNEERATRRLANFLDVASVLFADIGYETTTMTVIAERSGSGIGTLYHFFQTSNPWSLLSCINRPAYQETKTPKVLDEH